MAERSGQAVALRHGYCTEGQHGGMGAEAKLMVNAGYASGSLWLNRS